MRYILALVLAGISPHLADAADAAEPVEAQIIRPAGDATLEDFVWINRVIVVFGDSEADPRFTEQIELLNRGLDELAERDVIILTDADPAAMSPIRQKLRPRGFMMVLMGKDGQVYLRKPFPWDVREISRSIDKMPLRQREIRDRRSGG